MTRDDCLQALSDLLPGFSEYWVRNSWLNGSDVGEHSVLGVFNDASSFVSEELQNLREVNASRLFEYIEHTITLGPPEATNGAMVCFLENILNRTPTKIRPEQWIPFLGPKSREFCREWDKWTGYRTNGLWSESEIVEFSSVHQSVPKSEKA